MRSSSSLKLACFVVATGLSACGGKVVFFDGSGGAGGNASVVAASATHAATSTTGGTSCSALQKAFEDAITAAKACSAAAQFVQCDGSEIVNDTCGCPSNLLNEKDPTKVAAAKAAYAAWTQAGCGPLKCGASCMDAHPGFCSAAGDGTGVCTFYAPD